MEEQKYMPVQELVNRINAIRSTRGASTVTRQRVHYRLKQLGIQRFHEYGNAHVFLIRLEDANRLLEEAERGYILAE